MRAAILALVLLSSLGISGIQAGPYSPDVRVYPTYWPPSVCECLCCLGLKMGLANPGYQVIVRTLKTHCENPWCSLPCPNYNRPPILHFWVE